MEEDINNTMAYNDGHDDSSNENKHNDSTDKTSGYNDSENTAPYEGNTFFKKTSKTHQITAGDIIILKEKEYKILDIISEGTGEAVIYKIADTNANVYALKLYYEFINSNEEPSYETLQRILALDDSDILKLYDFGAGKEDKYQGKYCYEITAYAEGSDLLSVEDFKKKYTASFIENYIIPEIFKGINKLHAQKIYHCDLKPANVFYLDKQQTNIVIGDYGSAKAYDLDSEKDVRKSSTVKGTQFYIAPEQALGFISDKNDYYSFGMILLHLLYPESLCSDEKLRNIDRKKFKTIAERQFNEKPLLDFNNNYNRLNTLIAGLTLHNYTNRWSKKEVEKWLNKENVEVNYKNIEVIPIKLGPYTIKNENDLIHYLETNDKWHEELIEETDTYLTFKRWLDDFKDIPTRKLIDELIKYYAPSGVKYIKEAIIRVFNPYRPVFIGMHIFKLHESINIEQSIILLLAQFDKMYKILQAEEIKFIIFQLEFTLKQLHELEKDTTKKDKINEIIDTIFEPFSVVVDEFNYKTQLHVFFDKKNYHASLIKLLDLFYAFNSERKFVVSDQKEFDTLHEIALFYAAETDAMDNPNMEAERINFLIHNEHTKLVKLSALELVYEVFRKEAISELEIVSVHFEKDMHFEITYTFNKTLNNFLSAKGINNDFTIKSKKQEVFRYKKKKIEPYAFVFKRFVKQVCEEQNIATLTGKNLRNIKSVFQKQVSVLRKSMFRKQNIALLIFIICLLLIASIVFKLINIDPNWHIKLGKINRDFLYEMLYKKPATNEITNTQIEYPLYKITTNDVNIRSGPGKQYRSMGKAAKDEVFEIIDDSNKEWYKINYGNEYGYIYSIYLKKL